MWRKDEAIQEIKSMLTIEESIMLEEYVQGIDCTAVVINSGKNSKYICIALEQVTRR